MTVGAYAHRRSASEADKMVMQHAELVKRIAYHLAGRLPASVEVADLIQAGMLGLLDRKSAPSDQWRPIIQASGGLVPPTPAYPRLQVSPPFDLQAFRAKEDARLNSYGWINSSSGVVHIPITVAMDLLLKKGLPVRKSAGQPQPNQGPSSYQLQLQRLEQHTVPQEPPP